MNRRSIIVVLIGMIAGIAGFASVAYLRQRRCVGASGTWDNAVRRCTLPDGMVTEVARTSDIVVGSLIALALGFMLFRMFLFAIGRMANSIEQ
jgi:hypothetical protein